MNGDTLVHEDEDAATSTGSEKPFHYVRKADMARSAIEGTHVAALCGETFPVREVPKKSAVVCEECQRLFSHLRS